MEEKKQTYNIMSPQTDQTYTRFPFYSQQIHGGKNIDYKQTEPREREREKTTKRDHTERQRERKLTVGPFAAEYKV